MFQYAFIIFASVLFYNDAMDKPENRKLYDPPARCVFKVKKDKTFNQSLKDLQYIRRKPCIPSNEHLQRNLFIGVSYFQRRNFPQALECFNENKLFFLGDSNDNYLGTYRCPFAYLARGLILLQLNEHMEASKVLEKAKNYAQRHLETHIEKTAIRYLNLLQSKQPKK